MCLRVRIFWTDTFEVEQINKKLNFSLQLLFDVSSRGLVRMFWQAGFGPRAVR